ncbi:MAG: hypothetical protein GC158_02610 [Cyanobacteria bacterium RI_101]|nr:hypothetical protein [Cyanobacteria bacterium RI_101]
MKPQHWGFTNPIVSPLYSAPPLLLRDMRVQLVVYETDIDNVKRLIPDPLEVRTNKVITWISEFELGATQGGFKEMAIYVQVKYKDYEGDYEPFLYVNSPVPLTAGREIWGYQKKMAAISLTLEQEAVIGKVTRLDHQILKTLVVPEYEAKRSDIPWSRDGVFSLKYIPSAEENGEPLRELVLTEGKFTVQEGKFFGGLASALQERSEIDPTYLLEPKSILGGFFGQGELFLPFGKIVHDYK